MIDQGEDFGKLNWPFFFAPASGVRKYVLREGRVLAAFATVWVKSRKSSA
jgi:hypothetical protein